MVRPAALLRPISGDPPDASGVTVAATDVVSADDPAGRTDPAALPRDVLGWTACAVAAVGFVVCLVGFVTGGGADDVDLAARTADSAPLRAKAKVPATSSTGPAVDAVPDVVVIPPYSALAPARSGPRSSPPGKGAASCHFREIVRYRQCAPRLSCRCYN